MMDFTPVAVEAAARLINVSPRTVETYHFHLGYARGYQMALLHNLSRAEDWAKGRRIVDIPMEAGE